MTSSAGRFPLRSLMLLGSLVGLLLAVNASTSSAAVSFELSGAKRTGRCSSSQPLSRPTWTCLTKDLRVVAPGGPVRYAYEVESVKGCPTMGVIVRTTGRASALYSFTAMSAAGGGGARGSLTGNLSTISPVRFTPARGTVVKLSIELPYDTCSDLRSFKLNVRFSNLTKAR